MQHVWIPVLLAFITFLVSALIAFPLTFFLAQHKQEAVRRAMFACLILGNANSIPLLVLQSLCDTFEPLQEGGECYATSMGYATLFMTVINMIAVCCSHF